MATLLEKLRATGTNNRFNQPDLGYSQLPDSYRSQLRYFTGPEQDKILRYTHIFSNDLTPVLNYIDEMATEGRSNIKNHIKNSSKEDHMKWNDYKYIGTAHRYLGLVELNKNTQVKNILLNKK